MGRKGVDGEVKEEDEERSYGGGEKESAEGMEGVEGGGAGSGLVQEGAQEMVVEGRGLQDQVNAEMEGIGGGVKQELELDAEAFSDDDLL